MRTSGGCVAFDVNDGTNGPIFFAQIDGQALSQRGFDLGPYNPMQCARA
jgi:hypothetical protein